MRLQGPPTDPAGAPFWNAFRRRCNAVQVSSESSILAAWIGIGPKDP